MTPAKKLVLTLAVTITLGCGTTRPPDNSLSRILPVGGGGSVAVSDEVVSLWLTRRTPAGEPTRLVVVAYYRSVPRWHARKWEPDYRFSEMPSWLRLRLESLTLYMEYAGDGRTTVQDQIVDLTKANVFLVTGFDEGSATVTPVGKVEVPLPSPVVGDYILKTYPEIARRVGGS